MLLRTLKFKHPKYNESQNCFGAFVHLCHAIINSKIIVLSSEQKIQTMRSKFGHKLVDNIVHRNFYPMNKCKLIVYPTVTVFSLSIYSIIYTKILCTFFIISYFLHSYLIPYSSNQNHRLQNNLHMMLSIFRVGSKLLNNCTF